MILLPNIVKAVSVVDDRPARQRAFSGQIEAAIDQMPVIKRQIFNYRENPYADMTLVLPNKQGYIDELNRVKVEIAQAKAELRSLNRQIGEAYEENAVQKPQPALKQTDDPFLAQAAKEESERLLRETNVKIEDMLREARQKGEELKEQAKNEGYLAGFDEGFAQAVNEFKAENGPKARELENLLNRLSDYEEELVAQNERDILALVSAVAKKIVGQELKTDPRALAAMLYRVLDDNRREQTVRITVSPELMPVDAKVGADIKKLIIMTAPNAIIYIEEDAPEGTCVVESDKGITDISVDTQIENIGRLLAEQ